MPKSTKKLFVGGLPWGVDDEGLRAAFSPFGEIVEAKVITDRDTGRSRGFGFVSFKRDDDAHTAYEEMHNEELAGRRIRVDFADEKDRSPRR